MRFSLEDLPHSPACERNQGPIGQVLMRLLPPAARVLEIGAGTGQHAVHFTALRPDLDWLASDRPQNLADIEARFRLQAAGRLGSPLALDVAEGPWPTGPFDAVFTANTLHIMPFELTPRLLDGAATVLKPGGWLICYGPFHDGGVHTADSNVAFDLSLRQRDPAMGLRDALVVRRLAAERGLDALGDLSLPANNRLLLFRRRSTRQD